MLRNIQLLEELESEPTLLLTLVPFSLLSLVFYLKDIREIIKIKIKDIRTSRTMKEGNQKKGPVIRQANALSKSH